MFNPDTNVVAAQPFLGERLPSADIRTRFNERALRGWTESSRRVVRGAILLTSDTLAGLLGILTVQETWSLVSGGGRRPLPDEIPLAAMVLCLQPLALRVTGAYGSGKSRTDVFKLAVGIAIAAFLGWVQAQLFGYDTPSLPNKAAYLYTALVITAYAWTSRLLIDRVVRRGYRAGPLRRRVLVVGPPAEAEQLNRRCREMPDCELEIVARIAAKPVDAVQRALEGAETASTVPFVGSVDDLEEALSVSAAQGVIVVSSLSFARLEALIGDCFRLGASVSILPVALKRLSGAQLEVHQSAIGSLLHLRPVRLGIPQLAIKRSMDVALTLLGLAITWPLFVIIALAIKLDSRGPVFFSQARAGVGGKPFPMLKFRTMRVGADDEKHLVRHLNEYPDERLFKIKDDPRVTRFGRLLRRSSLDELPQLFNVLRGEMSLVGPRPFFPNDLAAYEQHHFERLHVLPGITGLWQVSGRSDVVDFEEVIRLDREYIENWSLLTDMAILLRTIPAAVRRGAY